MGWKWKAHARLAEPMLRTNCAGLKDDKGLGMEGARAAVAEPMLRTTAGSRQWHVEGQLSDGRSVDPGRPEVGEGQLGHTGVGKSRSDFEQASFQLLTDTLFSFDFRLEVRFNL